MTGHGGARKGAGAPLKRGLMVKLKIGQACEKLWRQAVKIALQAELNRLYSEASDIKAQWSKAAAVPVSKRKNWQASEDGEQHRADVETELHELHGTPDEDGPAPRVMSVQARPPRGTRKRIIAEVAAQFGESESAVDNLWQAYRRFERELQDSD